MTDDQIEKAHKLRNEGLSYWKIGAVLGISGPIVYRQLDSAYRERGQVYQAAYRAAHQIQIAKYVVAHKEERAAYMVAYRKANRPKCAAYEAAKRALILGATAGCLREIKEIYRRAKELPKIRCYLCGKLIPLGHRHVDHIIPLSKGGKHCPSNLAIACDRCNRHKYNKLPEELGLLL